MSKSTDCRGFEDIPLRLYDLDGSGRSNTSMYQQAHPGLFPSSPSETFFEPGVSQKNLLQSNENLSNPAATRRLLHESDNGLQDRDSFEMQTQPLTQRPERSTVSMRRRIGRLKILRQTSEFPRPRRYSKKLRDALKLRHHRRQFSAEQPKVLCRNKLSTALWKFFILHVPAITVTLILFALYIVGFQWEPPHPTSEELSGLLFAAKAHETLILISITDILLHRIHYQLLEKNGIALGFLSSPFYLSSPIQYFTSWELWGSVFRPQLDYGSHIMTIGTILFLTLISLSASPFSSVIMIPRFGLWKPANNAFRNTTWVNKYTDGYLYIPEMTFENWNTWGDDCDAPSGDNSTSCDQQTLGPLFAYLNDATVNSPYTPTFPEFWNSSVTRSGKPILARHISWSTLSSHNPQPDVALTSGPFKFVAETLRDDIRLARQSIKNDIQANSFLISSQQLDTVEGSIKQWKQPFTVVYCAPVLRVNSSVFDFENILRGHFRVDLDYENLLGLLNFTNIEPEDYGFGTGYVRYLDPLILDIQDKVPHSISAAIIFPRTQEGNASDMNFFFNLCLCETRWVYSETWMTADSSFQTLFDLNIPSEEPLDYLFDTWQIEPIVKLKKDWLVGALSEGANTTLVNPAYGTFARFCDEVQSVDLRNSTPGCLAICVSIYLTDALTSYAGASRNEDGWVGWSATWQRLSMEDALSLAGANQTLVVQTIRWYSYIYIFRGTSIIAAFTMLLVHVVIALLHNAIIIFSSNRWTSSAWRNFGSLMTLALRSKALQGLENVGAGVSSSGTWKTPVKVREIGEGGYLEILRLSDGDEESYISENNDGHRRDARIRRVKPGLKYR